jgi:predicted DNA-binding transcriptional regulator YafY
LGVSRATAYRILDRLKKEMEAPLISFRPGFVRYEQGKTFELPGFWLSEGEITALLGLMQWLTGPDSVALADLVGPLRKRLESETAKLGIDAERLQSLVTLLPMNARVLKPGVLRTICEALLQGRRLNLRYGEAEEERVVSPQKLVRYRDNWYLDAYCHLRQGFRRFALFRVHAAQVLKDAAKRIPQAELKAYFTGSYGIFGRPDTKPAVLRFTGFAADYVEGEIWHPREEKSREGDTLILKLPYSDSYELIRDIMRWGDEVEVLEPEALRKEIATVLCSASRQYES